MRHVKNATRRQRPMGMTPLIEEERPVYRHIYATKEELLALDLTATYGQRLIVHRPACYGIGQCSCAPCVIIGARRPRDMSLTGETLTLPHGHTGAHWRTVWLNGKRKRIKVDAP